MVTLSSIQGDDGQSEIEDSARTVFTFRRGAVRGEDTATIVDALFIAQYLAGLHGLSQTNLLNAASIFHDGPNGDLVTITDSLALAQQLAGLRDNSFKYVG